MKLRIVGLVLTLGLLLVVELGVTAQTDTVNQAGLWTAVPGMNADRISVLSADEAWAVALAGNGSATTVYRWDGVSWVQVASLPGSGVWHGDIQMLSATEGWLVLSGVYDYWSESKIYRWNGTQWSLFDVKSQPNGDVARAFDVLSADNIWLASGGLFWAQYYRWNGTAWTFGGATYPGVFSDSDIDMLADDNGWAVGIGGSIARYDGSFWVKVTSPTDANLNGIEMLSDDAGWIVGDLGTILRWNGSTWSAVSSPTSNRLYDIDMVSAAEGWAVGESGTILYWDGTTWEIESSPLIGRLSDVDMISQNDGWIVGAYNPMRYTLPTLDSTYGSGRQGSYFTISGAGFPPSSTATVEVNGQLLDSVVTDEEGTLEFALSTAEADAGYYAIQVVVNPIGTVQIVVTEDGIVHPHDGTLPVIDVPSGIARQAVFAPAVMR